MKEEGGKKDKTRPSAEKHLKTTPDNVGEHLRGKCVCVCLSIGMWRGAARASSQSNNQPTNGQYSSASDEQKK